MNILTVIKVTIAVWQFLASNKGAIAQLVKDAEAQFPEVGSGLQKLSHVLGGAFNLIQESGSVLASFPADQVAPLLTGHISSVAAALFPKK